MSTSESLKGFGPVDVHRGFISFLVMNGGVSKARTRRSRVQLSKTLQETLLDAVAGNIAHVEIPRARRCWLENSHLLVAPVRPAPSLLAVLAPKTGQ